MLELGFSDPEYAHELWTMCKRDILFWMNTFVYTYDPRLPEGMRVTPFITYPFQDKALLSIQDAIENQYSLIALKSRDQGASWMFIAAIVHDCDFQLDSNHLFVSRSEEYVDSPGNKKSLFWKMNLIHNCMPKFLWDKSHVSQRTMHYENLDTGSVIDGEATTADIARGDRRRTIFVDEFAAFPTNKGFEVDSASLHATNCRLINSTFKGPSGAFYDATQSSMKKLRMHWLDHPVQRRGAYQWKQSKFQVHGGTLEIIDKDFRGEVRVGDKYYMFPDNYPFIKDGKVRSPYYDQKEDEAIDKIAIKSELDIDPEGSASQFFDMQVLSRILGEDCREPVLRGELSYALDTIEPNGFEELPDNGKLLLWINLTANGLPPLDTNYVIGCDISTGLNSTMGSNSVASICDQRTGQLIGELASPSLSPEDFAEYVVALCRWFGGAYLVWEDNGPGGQFRKRVIDLGYRYFYYRRSEDSVTRKMTDKPGWWSSTKIKGNLLGEFRRALSSGEFVERHSACIDEAKKYINTPEGDIIHSASKSTIDPAGAKLNHGDRIISRAVSWLVMKGKAASTSENDVTQIKHNCMAQRMRDAELEEQNNDAWAA